MLVKTSKNQPNEIYSSGLKMCLMLNGRNIHTPIYCKDFISDIFWMNHCRKAGVEFQTSIYNFTYSRKVDLFKFKEFQLFLYLPSSDLHPFGENLQNFLNEAEVRINIPYSTVVPAVADNSNGLIITFDKAWTELPYLLSLFLIFVRVGLKYNNSDFIEYLEGYSESFCVSNANINDVGYLKKSMHVIKRIFLNQEVFNESYLDYKNISSCHNHSGIVALANKTKKE